MLIITTILKIIGIILLILLCVIIALLLIISLVPFRYEAEVSKYEKILADARVRWLFKLLDVNVHFDSSEEKDKVHISVKLAGFQLYDNLKPRQKKKKKEKKPEKEKAKAETAASKAEASAAKPPDQSGASSEAVKAEEIRPESAEKAEEARLESAAKPEQTRPESAEKPKDVHSADTEKPEKPKTKKKKARKKSGKSEGGGSSKLQGLAKHKDEIIEIIKDPANHKLIGKILHNLNSLIVKILPHIRKLYAHFGFADPSKTGKVMGYLGMAYPLITGSMELEPEFNKEVMEGEIVLSGKILILWFIIFAVKSCLNRPFIRLVKKVLAIVKDK
ncbi:MAG: DUF2953 domain-containing protein [Lachnospiraceae bacterium]|nr:DUF2953 domain-containing protein [Lachnospiraceae bacterium]